MPFKPEDQGCSLLDDLVSACGLEALGCRFERCRDHPAIFVGMVVLHLSLLAAHSELLQACTRIAGLLRESFHTLHNFRLCSYWATGGWELFFVLNPKCDQERYKKQRSIGVRDPMLAEMTWRRNSLPQTQRTLQGNMQHFKKRSFFTVRFWNMCKCRKIVAYLLPIIYPLTKSSIVFEYGAATLHRLQDWVEITEMMLGKA